MKNNLAEGIDFYYNEQGYIVLTEAYHLERGTCCGNGCKHCPYEYMNVPEPRKTTLLINRYNASGKKRKPVNENPSPGSILPVTRKNHSLNSFMK